MAIGKKEQIAVILVAAIAVAALVHFLIFAKRAETYKATQERYNQGVQTLQNAEIIEPAQEAEFAQFEAQTAQYNELVTSAVAALNLQAPPPVDTQTSPPVEQWASETLRLLTQIMDLGVSPQPTNLTFLGGQREQYTQMPIGWNMPRTLPNHTKSLAQRATELHHAHLNMQRSANPQMKYSSRYYYNQALEGLGLPPIEVAFFRAPSQGQWFFFEEEDMLSALIPNYNQQSAGAQMTQYYNVIGLHTLGVAVPALRKLWAYNLIKQGVPPASLQAIGEALKINIPLDDNTVDVVNKQLRTLVDVIELARKNRIDEIWQVRLLRPVDLVKGEMRQPGVVPSPTAAAATPAVDPMMMDPMMYGDPTLGGMGMGMGMGAVATPVPDADKIGTGTGLEIWFRGTNANIVSFMYDITHITRTYSLDDIDMATNPNAAMSTSVTVELVTQVDRLSGGNAAGGDPATDPAAEVPVQ